MRVTRRTARVLPVDADGRVLLLLGRGLLWRGQPFWMSAGGGVARGETHLQAAVRELREETGITADPGQLGRPVGTSVIRYPALPAVEVCQYQTYFALPVAGVRVSFAGQGRLERRCIEEYQWLSAAELEGRPERLSDPELPSLIRVAATETSRREVP